MNENQSNLEVLNEVKMILKDVSSFLINIVAKSAGR